jgi:ActR/RegA family two-component response regulator
MAKARLLFVDDEESIRLTLPSVLEMRGFEVSVAATVRDGLQKINSEQFDVLLTDLNIGQPSDGFTLVSAMRCTQPNAINIIITGYPDLDSALNAIRRQVDAYVIKPTNIDDLVQGIEERLTTRGQPLPQHTGKPVAQIVDENKQKILDTWVKIVHVSAELAGIELSDAGRIDHLPGVLTELTEMLKSPEGTTSAALLEAAKQHGRLRREQGYTIPLIVEETRILERVIYSTIQANLLNANFSSLIPDIIRIGDTAQEHLKASLEAYTESHKAKA